VTEVDAEALGRRWLTASGGWHAGMEVVHASGYRHRLLSSTHTYKGWWPDLRDAATRGAALEVVRQRWGNPLVWVEWEASTAMWGEGTYQLSWACVNGEPIPPDITGDSEAAVLVAALEAAPQTPVQPEAP
jgi:hypothetical protein